MSDIRTVNTITSMIKGPKTEYVVYYYIPVCVSPVISSNNLTVEFCKYISLLHIAYKASQITKIARRIKAARNVTATAAVAGVIYKFLKGRSGNEKVSSTGNQPSSNIPSTENAKLHESLLSEFRARPMDLTTDVTNLITSCVIGSYTIVATPIPFTGSNVSAVLRNAVRFKQMHKNSFMSYIKGLITGEIPVISSKDIDIVISATEKDDILQNLDAIKESIQGNRLSICMVDFATNSVTTLLSLEKNASALLTSPIHAAIDIRRTNLDLSTIANELSRTKVVTQGNASKVLSELIKRVS